MTARTLWIIVGFVWVGLGISIGFTRGEVFTGLVICAVLGALGYMRGKDGIR